MSSFFDARGVIVDLTHLGGLVLPTSFGVLMGDFSLGMVCETCLASCSTIAFAWIW